MLFSLDQTSLWRFEKLRIVDDALCALPQAAALGSLMESLGCAHVEGVDNYQTRSDSSDTKAALTSSLLVASKGRSRPVSCTPGSPGTLLITPERQGRLVS